MTGIQMRVGWRADPDSPVPPPSPGVMARHLAEDEAERRQAAREEAQRQARAAEHYDRALMRRAQEVAAETGCSLREAMRPEVVGRTHREIVDRAWAIGDAEDARREAERARAIRRLAVEAGLLDDSSVDYPGEIALNAEAHYQADQVDRELGAAAGLDGPTITDPQKVGRNARSRWLRRRAAEARAPDGMGATIAAESRRVRGALPGGEGS